MNFQQPTFLWALLLLVIPLIIHLFNFRKYKRVLFSNVAMLRQIQTESRKTRQIKKWLVLLTRMLILAALVIAFARPYLLDENAKTGRQLVSIYLDNSQSMRAEGERGELFENAKSAARTLLGNLPNEAEVQVVNNAMSPFSTKVYSPAKAEKIIDDMELDYHPNDFGKVMQRISNTYISQGYASQHTFAISDFQTSGYGEGPLLDSGISVSALQLKASSSRNLSVDSVWLEEPISRPGSPVKIGIKVTNNGKESVESANAVMRINGVQQGVESFGVAGGSEYILSMSFTSAKKGWVSGDISVNDVPVTFDNTYYFSLEVKPSIDILQIGESSSAIAKIFKNDPIFQYTSISSGAIDYAALGKSDFVILQGLSDVSSGLAIQLEAFVKKGGILTIVPQAVEVDYKSLTTGLGLAEYGAIVNKEISIASEDLKKPFLRDAYKRVPANVFLPKIKKSYSLQKGVNTRELLSLKDGSSLLTKTNVGAGSVYQYAVPLDASYSNIESHEVFVLSMLKMAFSKSEKQRLAYTLFDLEPIYMNVLESGADALKLVGDTKETLIESSSAGNDFRFWLNGEIRNAGIYSLTTLDNKELATVGLNFPRAESIQTFADEGELRAFLPGAEVNVSGTSAASLKNAVNDLQVNTPLWKLFIGLSLIFLLIEILLLRFLKS
jgi:hypothetical protein|tara:strand:- start:1317 stop:3320 length:2004 start_codon:yes stop_codon:yes gene_type:complete